MGTPRRGRTTCWSLSPTCSDEVPRGVLSQLKWFAEPSTFLSVAALPSHLCLARVPGEGSFEQPWVSGVFILPNLLKDFAGSEGNCIPEPMPERPFILLHSDRAFHLGSCV